MTSPERDIQFEYDRLSPEERMLVLCAGMHDYEGAGKAAGKLLSGTLDWETLVERSLDHGVASLLRSFVDRWDAGNMVPDRVSRRLKDIYYANGLRAMQAEQQLAYILTCLTGGGVDAVLLKGLFLSKTVYKNVALRPTGDIDLLIRRSDIERADALLRGLGFKLASGSFPLSYYREVHFHVMYLNGSKVNSIPLEIHWGVQDRFNVPRVNMDEIWARVRPWSIADCDTYALHPEHLIAYLCYHADKHTCFSRYVDNWSQVGPGIVLRNKASAELLWYADILRMLHLEGDTLDWTRLAGTCRRWGIDDEVYSSLAVTKSIFGTSLADAAIDRLQPPRPGRLKAAIYRRLMSPPKPGGRTSTSLGDATRRRLLESGLALQFRPVRLLDIAGYVCPDPGRMYQGRSLAPPRFYLHYLGHVLGASLRVVSYLGLLIACFLWKSIRRT